MDVQRTPTQSSLKKRASKKLVNLKELVSSKFSPPLIETDRSTPYEYAIFCRDLTDKTWRQPSARDVPKNPNMKIKYPKQSIKENGDGGVVYPKPKFGEYEEGDLGEAENLEEMLRVYDPLKHLLEVLRLNGCEFAMTLYEPEPLKRKRQGNRHVIFVRLTQAKIAELLRDEKLMDLGAAHSSDQNEIEKEINKLSSAQRTYMLDDVITDPHGVHIRLFEKLGDFIFVEHFCIIHDRKVNNELFKSIRFFPLLTFNQIQTIRCHFGEKIAFYFAWLDFYNRMLLLLGIVGCLVYLFKFINTETYERILPFFGILTLIWGTTFNLLWKRRENELALIWQVPTEKLGVEKKRYEYYQQTQNRRISPVTGKEEEHFPGNKRLLRYAVSVLVFLFQGMILVVLTSLIYLHSVWAYFYFANNPSMQTLHVSVINTLLYVILIVGANYTAVVVVGKALTNWENHPTNERYDRMLAHKIFSFYFIDGFLWYIILAFVQIPLTGSETMNTFLLYFGIDMGQMKIDYPEQFQTLQGETYWMNVLETTIVGYFTMSQFFPIIIESLLPVVVRRIKSQIKKLRTKQLLKKDAKRKSPSQELELQHTQYDHLSESDSDDGGLELEKNTTKSNDDDSISNYSHLDEIERMKIHIFRKDPARSLDKLRQQAKRHPMEMYDDYEDMILEYGYILVFSSLWPLVPILAFVNNLLEVSGDFYRMINTSKRVAFDRERGIGVYQDHLDITTNVSVVMTLGLVMVATHNLDVYFEFFVGTSYETIVFEEGSLLLLGGGGGGEGTPHTKMWIRFLIAVVVEHLIFFMQRVIAGLIPRLPKWVKYEQERLAYEIREFVLAKHN